MLGNLLGGFITILIGVNLIGPIADDVYGAGVTNTTSGSPSNVTGAALTILQLTPLFFALGIMTAGVALAIGGLRNAGVM